MKEKIDSSDIPTSYLLCMKQDCPKATTCLRRIAEQQIGDEVKLWHVISPKYQEKQTDRCARFHRDAGPDALQTDAGSHLQADETVRTQDLLPRAKRRTPALAGRTKKHVEHTETVRYQRSRKVRCLLRGIRLVSSHDATCLRIGCAIPM